MIYLSLDIETTGLDPASCDILEIGAYIEDTNSKLSRNKIPVFHRYFWKDNYRGEPYALAMNAHIFQKILELRKRFLNGETLIPLAMTPEEMVLDFKVWIGNYFDTPPKLVLAGKNVMGFDIPFLKTIPSWNTIKFHHRHIDPAMFYFDPKIDDVPPDLTTCKKRAGLSENVSHEALDDAWDVIQLIRKSYD